MKTIYIIRHGQTEYNKLKLVQGSGIDSNLNEVGWAQGEAFFNQYRQISFDKVYTSTLKRTHQTVQCFLDKKLPWEQLEGLNEISWGKKEGKIITAEDDRQYYEMLDAWRNGDWHWKVEGGESPLEVQARQKRDWDQMMGRTHEQTILVCMHGRAMRILLCLLTNTPLSKMDQFSHSNTCLYLLKYFDGKYLIEMQNDITHLDKMKIKNKNCHIV